MFVGQKTVSQKFLECKAFDKPKTHLGAISRYVRRNKSREEGCDRSVTHRILEEHLSLHTIGRPLLNDIRIHAIHQIEAIAGRSWNF
jgi:hypothetical protein